jgi:hypothetical protein
MTKNCQEAKMEEIQAKSQSRKNRIVCFFILECSVFVEQIEYD